MPILRHAISCLCGLALVAAAFTTWRAQGQPVEPLRIAGNMTTIELAPVLVAAEGFYRGPVTVINGGIPALVAGEVDAATNAETQALRQSVDDPGIRIIFTVAEGFYRVVARRSAGIAKMADLRGKRITAPRNTSAHWFLVKSLQRAGVREEEITLAPINPVTAMSGALGRREVDAIAMWEPESERAIDAAGDDAIVLQERGLYRELFNLQTTTRVLANPAKRAALVGFLRSLMAASESLRARPRDFWPMISSRINVSEAMLERSWPHLRYAGGLASDLLDVMEEEEVWVARERNRAPRTRAQLAALIDSSLLEEARR